MSNATLIRGAQLVERIMVDPSKEDTKILGDLITIAPVAGPIILQNSLDRVTFAPTTTANDIRAERQTLTEGQRPRAELRALEAAMAAYKSNIILRLSGPDGRASADAMQAILANDELYLERRRQSWYQSNDWDAYRRMGSAMLWGLARYAAGLPVSRDHHGEMTKPRPPRPAPAI